MKLERKKRIFFPNWFLQMKEHGLPPLKLFTQSHHRSNVFSPKILIYKQRVHPAAAHLRNEFDQKSDLFSNCSQPPIYHFHILYSFQEFCNQGPNCASMGSWFALVVKFSQFFRWLYFEAGTEKKIIGSDELGLTSTIFWGAACVGNF